MGQQVPIGSIVIRRALDPGDDLGPLMEHIRDSGLRVPVLVNQDYELIDGLRRVEAVRRLGNTRIEVIAVTLYGPALTWIERARVHGVYAKPLTPRRMFELYESCKPLISVTRSQQMRGRQRGEGVHIKGRERFLAAIGIDSESWFQAVTQLYRMSKEDSLRGETAREAVAMLEEGQVSPYMALDYVRTRRRPGIIVKAEEQLAMLDSVASSLAGMAYGIKQLGLVDPSIPRERRTGVAKELREFRSTLHRLITQLEKEPQ